MRLLYIEWSSYGNDDIKEAMIAEGHELVCFPFPVSSSTYRTLQENPEVEERLRLALHRKVPDAVYSTNYFPVISKVCQKEHIRYISWNYDAPNMLLYSETVANSCNVIYTFDKAECRKYREMGISHIYYLPLAVNTDRLDALDQDMTRYDVSFVGSLYLERMNYFDQVESLLSDRARGYLKALIAVQLQIQGYNFVTEMLPAIAEELQRVCPVTVQPGVMASSETFHENVIITPRITAIERLELLEAVAQNHVVDLFTHMKDCPLPNIRIHGKVDYYNEMPLVFKQSKINLNLTSRSIQSGVPLRAFDIMGAGGFLLSNYQEDFLDHFIPGEDFVYYESKKDLLSKVDYYLRHEDERQTIAENGHGKVVSEHTYRHRVCEMLGGF